MSTLSAFLRALWDRPLLAVCAGIVLVVTTLAVVGPWMSQYGYGEISDASLLPPDRHHWFGTDIPGRDLLARTLYGARISLMVAALGACISLFMGVTYGMISGYVGGWLDNLMMRVVDIIYSLPSLILVIILVTTLETPVGKVQAGLGLAFIPTRIVLLIIFLGLTQWLTMARIVRGQVLVLREQAFIQAAKALGQGHLRILFHHMLPNLSGIVVVYLTLTVPVIMIDEAFMSFLGLGVQPPQASWGTLIADGAFSINPVRLYWWLLVFPGGMMAITLLALNFLGDGLRDALDPRNRK